METTDNNKPNPEQQPLVAKTIRVEQQDLEQWNQVKRTLEENFGRKVSDTEVFGEVMTRYFMPQRANEAATRQIQERDTAIADYENRLRQLQQESDSKSLKEGEHVIAFRPGYYEVLERVAQLEGKRRGQPWTPSDVIGFFTYSRFIKGNLNGDLNALPDSECRKVEQQLGISLDPRRAAAPQKKEAAL